MSLLDRVAQRLEQRSLHALGRVFRDPHLRGDPVGGPKADAPHVDREAVRIARDDRDRFRAVALEDAGREMHRRAVRLEEHHHVADRALLAPRRGELIGPNLSEPGDLAQAMRLLVEHLQRLELEMLHDALRGDLADAFDHPRAQVLLDPAERRWCELGDVRRADLLAVHLVDLDRAADAHPRSREDTGKEPDDGEAIAPVRHVHFHDAETRLVVFERDERDFAFDRDFFQTVSANSLAPALLPRGISVVG